MSDNYKQLYEKTNEEYKGFYPLTDILSIIDKESGKNLKQLINQYNHIKLDWKGNTVDTRNSVPLILRHKGLFVTYDNGTSIITEFYKGEDISASINSIWQHDNNWTDLSPGASLADNEDIAEIDGKFKFANRNYNAAQFTGMGKIILRKNLIDVGDGAVKNVLTQDMINKSNTVYVIQYDFTLGEDITIPENCVLKFDGGSISASSGENMDTITGSNTGISAGLIKIFNTNVTLVGTWNVVEAYPEWFGAVGDGETDDTTPIQTVINFSSLTKCKSKLSVKTYIVRNIEIKPYVTIEGIKNSAYNGDNLMGSVIKSNSNTGSVFYTKEHETTKSVSLSNFSIVGNKEINGITLVSDSYYWSFNNISVQNCNIGINIGRAWHLRFEVTNTYYCNIGFKVSSSSPLTCTTFTSCISYAGDLGFDFRADLCAVTLISCATDGCKKSMNINACYGVSIIDYEFEQYSEYGIKVCSIDSYITFNGLRPGGYIVDEAVEENINIIVEACGGITFLNTYLSEAGSPPNGYHINVAKGYESRVTFIDSYIWGNNNVNIDNCKYIGHDKSLLHSVRSYTLNSSNAASTFEADAKVILLDNLNVDVVLSGQRIFNINKLKIGDTIQLVNLRQTPIKIKTGVAYGIECNNNAFDTISIQGFGSLTLIKRNENFLGVAFEDIKSYGKSSIELSSIAKYLNSIHVGISYFNTTLNRPVWWTGEKWVDATGANV